MPGGRELRYGVINWRDGLSCRLGSGLPLFPKISEALYMEINASAARQFACWFNGGRSGENQTEALRLAHGRTLGEVLDRMGVAAVQHNAAPKLVLYGGHDVTVMPLLMMLTPKAEVGWPSYCSDLRYELWREKAGQKRLFVRVQYGPGTHGAGKPFGDRATVRIQRCGGQEFCELDTFKQVMGQYVVSDFDKECGLEGVKEAMRPGPGLSQRPGEAQGGSFRQL